MNPLSYFYTIRSYVDSYSGFLGRRFLSLLWVGAACFLIWFYGYLVVFGDFAPLASATNRLIAIAVVIVIWLVWLAVTAWRSRKRDKEMIDGIEQDAEALAEGERSAEVAEIRSQLQAALKLLKRVTRKRLGYVYELPWYVIFGAPGSGKTTAITNSGLSFPLGEASEGQGARSVAGTRSCNWWLAEEAILVDTAGRYTTQDDLNGAAKAGWEGFLNLLKRHRRSQPVNGAIITLSIADILSRDAETRLDEVRAIRKRLNEMDEFLKARVPIYIVLTKADLLTGFVEFFDGLSKSDREQVWGMTFDPKDSETTKNLPDRFLEEFGLLQERVGSMLIERLQQEPDSAVRGRIFRFPAELSALKLAVNEVMQELCTGSKIVEPPLMRGIYLASGTQEAETAEARRGVPRMRRSYFLTRLFKEVIFGEANLVSRDRRLSSRQRALRAAAYGIAAFLGIFVLANWTVAYFQNRTALAAAVERIDAYENALNGVNVTNVSDEDFVRVLPALNALNDVTAGFDSSGFLPIEFGLDQRPKIASQQSVAYQRALNALLLPRLLVHLRKVMQEGEDQVAVFDALKFYGMIGGFGEIQPDFVEREAERMFAELYPEEARAAVREALAAHVVALMRGELPPMSLDQEIIASARAQIADIGYGERAFDILASSASADALPSFLPSEALGPVGSRVFWRASDAPLNQGIDGLYTATGYKTVVIPMIDEVAREALSEDWVRGSDTAGNPASVETIASAALNLYFDRFKQRWSDLLSDLRVRPSQTLAEETETARVLAGDPGPIQTLAKAVAEATNLSLTSSGEEVGGNSLGDRAEAVAAASPIAASLSLTSVPDPYGELRKALAEADEEKDEGGENAPPPDAAAGSDLAAVPGLLDAIYQQLSRASTSTAAVAEVFDADGQLTTANQDLLQAARRLPEPVATWLAGLSADISALAVKTARVNVREVWANQGARLCSAAITNRYPFTRDSSDDIPLADFVRLFAPDGLFDGFFKANLAPFVDTSSSPWTWRGTFGAAGTDSQALATFERADAIRRAFFPPGSDGPSIAINIAPVSLSENANAVMLESEGERVVYYHGPKIAKSLKWPSPESQNRSLVAFQPGDRSDALARNGDWSIFRLFDAGEIERRQDDMLTARFTQNGHRAAFDVQFGSVLNPFRMPAIEEFECPSEF
ncbi:type VI secretion system membrane subunit TssM [Fulvimarina sp. MAC8]|uniref:type VI secretion system membrane subunit TssM n=1 Tax=Fulvimarina sp. MAC8 TaxID=3162874 RepID=UPI0032ECE587